jgi:hypothetical protein
MPVAIFALVILQVGSHVFCFAGLDLGSSYLHIPSDWEDWQHHHAQLLVEIRSCCLFRLASIQDPPDLHLLSSWDYRCELPHPVFFGFLGTSSHNVIQAGLWPWSFYLNAGITDVCHHTLLENTFKTQEGMLKDSCPVLNIGGLPL